MVNLAIERKINIVLFFLFLSFVGFMFGRAILSIGVIGFSVLSIILFYKNYSLFHKGFWITNILWCLSIILSLAWSNNLSSGWQLVQLKFPILIMPLAFGLLPTIDSRKIVNFFLGMSILILIGICYSIYHYYIDHELIHANYGRSSVMKTLAYNDYIRFSQFVALFIVSSVYAIIISDQKWQKIILIVIAIISVVFLHMLAVRTGLLSFYVGILAWLVYFIQQVKSKFKWLLVAFLLLSPLIAYQIFPTIQSKVGYTRYTIEEYFRGNRSAEYSDLGRLLSYNAALNIIKESPFTGVGIGDVLTECMQQYRILQPTVEPKTLMPHNQFLMSACSAGIQSLILLLLLLFYPLLKLRKGLSSYLLIGICLMLLLSLMVEPMLEIQMGVFLFSVFLSFAYSVNHKEQSTINYANGR